MKRLSHYERTNTNKADKHIVLPIIQRRRHVVSREYDNTTMRYAYVSKLVTYKPSETLSKLKVSDFFLDNLISIGAPLQPAGTLNMSRLETTLTAESALSKIDNIINEQTN